MRIQILATLAAASLAGDGKPDENPPRKEIERGEWAQLVQTIRANGKTTVKRLAALKSEASKYYVVGRGKILDVTHASLSQGKGALEIKVVGVGGERVETSGFIVRAPDADEINAWSKWDRLAWRMVPRVDAIDSIRLEVIYRTVGDLHRTPNPGARLPTFKKIATSMALWHRTFTGYVRYRRYAPAWRMIQKASGKAFARTFWVAAKDDRGLTVEWNGMRIFLEVQDPQVRELIEIGSLVTVAALVETNARTQREFADERGRWGWRYEFWKPAKS